MQIGFDWRWGVGAGLVLGAVSACGGGAGSGGGAPIAPPGNGSYSVAWTTKNSSMSISVPGGPSTNASTITLSNAGNAAVQASLLLGLPAGFSASGLNTACGASFTSGNAGSLQVASAAIPAGGQCQLTFTLTAPGVSQLAGGSPVFTVANGSNSASLSSQSVPSISLLGNTPGGHAWWSFPGGTAALAVMDMFITPTTDPGPNSNIFWANQLQALGGYTGIQSTMLSDASEGIGRQFLFSLWGAINFQTGTPASAGIGGGSFCTLSGSATDGSAGVQCRYRYEWQAGHTYRFRVTPQPQLGAGWFKSNVTDVTGGIEGDSFDIGTIQVDTTKTGFQGAVQSLPPNDLSQWTEYFEWNSERATPLSTPYSSAAMSVTATDVNGASVTLTNTETDATAPWSTTTLQGSSLQEISGIGQSARGLFKARGQCLVAAGNGSLNAAGNSGVALGSCPTLATVRAQGGSAFGGSFWVLAADGSIELPDSYCLATTDPDGAAATGATVQTCSGSSTQQWAVLNNGAGGLQSLQSASAAGQCLVADASARLSMGACGASSAIWTVPGNSFSY